MFQKQSGKVVRVSDTSFEPGDLYCGVWHLFDLIPQGAAGWQPKFKYREGLTGCSAGPPHIPAKAGTH